MMNMSNSSATEKPTGKIFRILRHLYDSVEFLVTFIQNASKLPPEEILHLSDRNSYKSFLHSTVVCTQSGGRPVPDNFSAEQHSHQNEIVHRVIERLRLRDGRSGSNVISVGYDLMSDDPATQMSSGSARIESRFPNSNTSQLQSTMWSVLLAGIGDDLMEFLLENRSIFLSAGNSCLIQLTGTPLQELWAFRRRIQRPRPILRPKGGKFGRSLKNSLLNDSKQKSRKRHQKRVLRTGPEMVKVNGSAKVLCQTEPENAMCNANHIQDRGLKSVPLELCTPASETIDPRKRKHSYSDTHADIEIKRCKIDVEDSSDMFDHLLAERTPPTSEADYEEMSLYVTLEASEIVDDCSPNSLLSASADSSGTSTVEQVLPKLRTVSQNDQAFATRKPVAYNAYSDIACNRFAQNDCSKSRDVETALTSVGVRKHSSRQRKGKLSVGAEAERGCRLRAFNPRLAIEHTIMFYSRALSEKFPPPYVLSKFQNADPIGIAAEKLVDEILATDVMLEMTDSEGCGIAFGYDKVRPKLTDIAQLLLRNHTQCRYKYLLQYHCSPEAIVDDADQGGGICHNRKSGQVQHNGDPAVDANDETGTSKLHNLSILPDLAQAPTYCRSPAVSKVNSDTCDVSGDVKNLRDEAEMPKTKPSIRQLLERHCSRRSVFLFIRACCIRVFPSQIFGSSSNRNVFLRNVRHILSMGRFEQMPLDCLMQRMRVTGFGWMREIQSNVCRSRLLAKLVLWMLHGYVLPLVRSYFYVTDTATYRNRMFFYRKAVWKRIQQKGLAAHLHKGVLQPISKEEARMKLKSGESLGVAYLRFLPKSTSLRPIVNLSMHQRIPNAPSRGETTINWQLADLHHVLTYERKARPKVLGSSVFSLDDVYDSWKRFVTRRQQRGDARPLYFVKVDIEDCYDSIDQRRLYDIIAKALEDSKQYVIRQYTKVFAAGGRLRRRNEMEANPLTDFEPCFVRFVERCAADGGARNAVFVDKVTYAQANAASLLQRLRSLLFSGIVRIGSRYFAQVRGIMQGSVISTLLCNNYYGQMEAQNITISEDEELLMRQVDDFLYVTPDRDNAVAFLTLMLHGVASFNCRVNPRKTLVNFCVDPSDPFKAPPTNRIPMLPAGAMFPWCGLLIDTKTLAVCADFTRYAGIETVDTMTIDITHNPGSVMRDRILFSIRGRCHRIFVDPSINPSVTENIYRTLLMAAFKLHAYHRRLPMRQNIAYVIETVFEISDYVFYQSSGALPVKLDSQSSSNMVPTLSIVRWLGLTAFGRKLHMHEAAYHGIFGILWKKRQEIENSIDAEQLARLKSTVGPEDCLPSDFKYFVD